MADDANKPEENRKPEVANDSAGFGSYDTDTQFDMESIPGTSKKPPEEKKPKRRTAKEAPVVFDPNSTDEFNFDQFEETKDEIPEEVPEVEAAETATKFHRPASILDLLKNKDDSLPIVTYEEDGELDKRLEGKTLDDVLKLSHKGKDSWHESEKAKERELEKAAAAKKRQHILFIVTPLIIIFSGILCFYIVLPSFGPPPETEAIKLPKRKKKELTPEQLNIDPNLKDSEKLENYFKWAEKLFEEKKYDKAEIVYTKLLPTGWRSESLLARLGECRDQQKDQQKAIEFYKKAINAGFGSNVEIPNRLGILLKEQGKYQEIYDILSPLQERFVSCVPFQLLLAETYWQLKMKDKSLTAYRAINKQFLNQEQLGNFAELLMEKGDKKEAFSVYLFLAQNFHDFDSFVKAAEVAPDQNLKTAVLTELIGKTLGRPEWNYYNLLLGECLLSQGKKKEAVTVLEKVKPEKLKGEHALRFLKLVAELDDSSALIESCEIILTQNYINNLPVQEEIRDALITAGKRELAEKVFSKQVVLFPHSPIANYMFATVINSNKLKQKYFNAALDINPKFYSAALALGKLYSDEGELENAISKFQYCISINPNLDTPRYLLAIVKIRQSEDPAILKEYQSFLQKNGTQEPQVLKQMVLLAQYLPTSTEAMKYIDAMAKYPELNEYAQLQLIRTKLMYGTLQESDFKGVTASGVKKYHTLFLLGQGKIREVMMMPLLKEEFPDYWKVFLCWRKNISSWRANSQLLIFKHPNDPLMVLSAKLWLWELSPAEAETMTGRLDYEDIPLFYLMIAERYRKDNNKIKSSIAYLTAMRYHQPNLYSKVVEYFKDHE